MKSFLKYLTILIIVLMTVSFSFSQEAKKEKAAEKASGAGTAVKPEKDPAKTAQASAVTKEKPQEK